MKKEMGFGFKRDFGQRLMYKTTCTVCGGECEITFKPTEWKPIYCKEV